MKSREQLKAVAEDLIRTMQLTERNENDEKVPIAITDSMKPKEIEEFIKTAMAETEPGDKFSKETLEVLEEFGKDISELKEKLVLTLEEEIEEAETMKQLKDICQSEPKFKAIRGKLSSFKDIDSLREEMMWLFTNAIVPKKLPKEQELPIEETQQEVANKLNEKLEMKKPKVAKLEEPENIAVDDETILPDIEKDNYPDENQLLGLGTMKTEDILTIKPFNEIFDVDEKVYQAVVRDMRKRGYDPAFPIVVWGDVVIDGHTRLEAAEECKIKEVPIFRMEFADEKEAVHYAIHNQRDRRNLSDAELLRCIEIVDKPMSKKEAGKKGGKVKVEEFVEEPVKSHKETAKKLGIGETKVTDARVVLADEKAKVEVLSGKKTISKAAKEIKEKKTASKPKKAKVGLTRIQAICNIIKANADSEMKLGEVVEEADMAFEDEGGKSDMVAMTKAFDTVLEVLVAIGFVTKLDEETIKIEEL